MARPRLHPRRRYRAIETGVYFDDETGDELTYYKNVTVMPDTALERDYPNIPLARQEKLAKKLVRFGVFECLDDDLPAEIERVNPEPTEIK